MLNTSLVKLSLWEAEAMGNVRGSGVKRPTLNFSWGCDLRSRLWDWALHWSLSLAGSSHLCPYPLRVLSCGAFDVTFCTALGVDIPTGMCFLPFTQKPISRLLWHWSFIRPHRSGWQDSFCVCQLPELLLTHGMLTHLCHTPAWGLGLSPDTLTLFLTCSGWYEVPLYITGPPEGSKWEIHTSLIFESFPPESQGRFSDHLLPEPWKVPQTLTSPKRASLTSPQPFKYDLMAKVTNQVWFAQINFIQPSSPLSLAADNLLSLLLAVIMEWRGWGWRVMTMKEKEQNPYFSVLSHCHLWILGMLLHFKYLHSPFHRTDGYDTHYGYRLIIVMDWILRIF